MLCDDQVRKLIEMSDEPGAVGTLDMAGKISAAQRFVLSPHVVETVDSLMDARKIEDMRQHLFTPAEQTWIEWRGSSVGHPGSNRHGLYLEGVAPASISTGWGLYIYDVPKTRNLPNPFPFMAPLKFKAWRRRRKLFAFFGITTCSSMKTTSSQIMLI